MTAILVVDDNPVDRTLVNGLLKSQYELVFAIDGQEAVEKSQQIQLDLILTDLRMPRMDGFELVSAIKKTRPGLPIVLMTSVGSEEIAIAALQKGASSYIPKRLLAQNLLDTLNTVLTSSMRLQDLEKVIQFRTSNRMEFELDNDAALISPLIGLLQRQFIDTSIADESERIRVAIALEEAFSNALYHGNLELDSALREESTDGHDRYYALAQERRTIQPYADRRILVDAYTNAEEFGVIVRDDGPGFDPSTLPDPTDPENIFRVHGRGLMLIRTFMDEVRHNATGNEITMIKRRGTDPNAESEAYR